MHTPRLCIDARAPELPIELATELVDQLISAQEEVENPWVSRHRTVLLTTRKQIFAGQLKRHNTRLKVRNTPFHIFFERQFLETANISAFHRFRPIDSMRPSSEVCTFTTLLPPSKWMPPRFRSAAREVFVVPSSADKKLLIRNYAIDENRIATVVPSIRRSAQFLKLSEGSNRNWMLFLVGRRSDKALLSRLLPIVQNRFPTLSYRVVELEDTQHFNGKAWSRLLSETQLCFYLSDTHFDWPIPALECVYLGIPTFFSPGNFSLGELLGAEWNTSSFMAELPDWASLFSRLKTTYSVLDKKGVFDPLSSAKQYANLYLSIPNLLA